MNKLGKYQIIEKIGEGGFGTVYKATDTTLDRVVALKVLKQVLLTDPVFLERFRREAKAAAALKHPNIVVIHELGEEQGQYYIAMEYVQGKSLADVLREKGPLSLENTTSILRQLANALDYAHERGLIHRDLKPSNVLISDDGHVTLTDFGLVKSVESSALTSSSNTFAGTPAYIAPEIWDGKEASGRTDVYALGILAFEILTGRAPFDGKTPAAIIKQHLLSPIPF